MPLIDLDKVTVEELCKAFEEDGVKVSKAMVTKAKKGQSTAMANIASKYAPKHIYDKAFEWYLLAANHNNIDAFLQVGNHYFRGEGVDKNYLHALEWYLKYISLSRNTKTTVLSSIVDMFAKGLGVPANEVKAHEWNQINENQTYSFMLGGTTELSKEKKDLDVLITESQEIVRIEMEKKTAKNGSKELPGESETITIDSPSPSSSGQHLQEQLQQYNQRQQQNIPFQPMQPMQQKYQLQQQPQKPVLQPPYLPQPEPKQRKSRNSSRSQGDIPDNVQSTHYMSNVAPDLNQKKIQYLEDTNFHLIELLKQEKYEKGELYNTLKGQIASLENENRDIKKKMEETQQSNQNLTVLLEQERRIRKNEMELADQERKKIMKRN